MSNKEGLEKYLQNLPRNGQGPGPSNLRGPRAPAKPAKWRSPSIGTSHSRQDLVYTMEQKLNLNDGIRDQVNRLQGATGTVVSTAVRPTAPPKPAVSSKPSTPPTMKNAPDAADAFEASLDPRRRPHPPRPPPQTPPKPSSPIDTQRSVVVSSSTSPSLYSSASQQSSRPANTSPPPQQQSPPVAAAAASPSSPIQQNNERISVPNPLYMGVKCAGCEKPISGRVIRVDHNQWHVDCFTCKHCGQDLEHVAFYSKDGQPYCALDYHELFSPRCDYCNTPIEEKSINALGKHYHVGHFFCRGCSKPFGESDAFMVHDGHAYCEKDYMAKFGHKCMGCGEYITGEFIGALGGEWHKECFVCADCGKAFESATFYVRNNKPFCHQHYKSGGKVCCRCNELIDGRSASAFGKDYHTHHFQCARCSKLLSSRVPGMWQEGAPGELVCRVCARAQT